MTEDYQDKDASTNIDTVLDVTESLEALNDITVTESTKHLLTVSTESLYRRLNIAAPVHDSNIATEGVAAAVGDAIKKAYKAIARIIKAIWDKLSKFVKNLFDVSKNSIKEAESLKKKIKDGNYTTLKDSEDGNINAEFEDEPLAENFSSNKTIDDRVVLNVFAVHKKFTSETRHLPETIERTTGLVDKNINLARNRNTSGIDYGIDLMYKEVETATNIMLAFMMPGESTGSDLLKSGNGSEREILYPKNGVLFGNKQIEFKIDIQTPKFSDMESDSSFDLNFSLKDAEEKGDSTKLTILNKEEMLRLCDAVIDLAKGNTELCKATEKAKDNADKLAAALDKVMGINSNPDDQETARKIRRVIQYNRRVVSVMGTKTGAFAGTIVGLNGRLCKSTLVYVKKCMNSYQ